MITREEKKATEEEEEATSEDDNHPVSTSISSNHCLAFHSPGRCRPRRRRGKKPADRADTAPLRLSPTFLGKCHTS